MLEATRENQKNKKPKNYNLLVGHFTALSISTKMGQIFIYFLRAYVIQEFR